MKHDLSNIKTAIQDFVSNSDLTELQVIEKLHKTYYAKHLSKNLTLYKKGKKTVRQITLDLKMSPRKFYQLLENKKINYRKPKKKEED